MKGQNLPARTASTSICFNHALWEGVMGRGVRYPSELEARKKSKTTDDKGIKKLAGSQ